MSARFGLEQRIKFAGYRYDLPNVLAAMDVFAFTSIEKDTSPLALLSAMACGLPVIGFDIAGVRELIAGEDQFVLVPVEDVGELSRALSRVLTNEKLRRTLGAAARKRATADFDLETYTARIEQVLRKALLNSQSSVEATLPENHQTASGLNISS